MKKELGKWLMDIAKYVATAFLISSFLGEIKQTWLMYVVGAITVLITFSVGLWVINIGNKEEKQQENRRNKK